MLKNYFKIAFRSLWKHRYFSLINLLGLAAGLSAAFLIFLYVRFELSYDGFHANENRIYRLACDVKTATQTKLGSLTSEPMAAAIKKDFPEVEDFARISPMNILIHRGDIKFQEDHVFLADASLFSVFSFPLVKGDPKTALSQPFSIVLSESASRKYFGNRDAVGQTLLLSAGNFPCRVTAVMRDMPANSHFRADLFVSALTFTEKLNPDMQKQWDYLSFYSYLLLKPGVNPTSVGARLPQFLQDHIGRQMRSGNESFILSLEPLRDIYLRSPRPSPEKGSMTSVYIFSLIAAFILLIACVNFINLITARAAERAKEIGVRKLIGAERKQLAIQFLGESLLHALLAFILALVFCEWLLPQFNQLSGKLISDGIIYHSDEIGMLFLGSVGIGLVAGCYPALVLSGFRPIEVISGRFSSGRKGILFRKILVVGQFTISIVLIAATLIVYRQTHFMLSQPLGFDKDQTLVIDYHGDERIMDFKNKLSSVPEIQSSTLSSSLPGHEGDVFYTKIESKTGEMLTGDIDCYNVDFDFLKQYGIGLVAGRGFSRDFGTDCPNAMLINESALAGFGFRSPKEAIAKRFEQGGRQGTIIGVMKDFHFQGLQQKIKPLTMRIEPDGGRCVLISIKISQANIPAVIARIQQFWKETIPDRPFSYDFLDESFNQQYQGDSRFGKLFLFFSLLAIFISCLGLLGLASYSTLQRTREIGIRKVFGASVYAITSLLTRDFLNLVLLAFTIATPISWLLMHRWLHDFAYRVGIGWWVFLLAGLSAFMIAALTVSFQAIRAALANPVRSLRSQ